MEGPLDAALSALARASPPLKFPTTFVSAFFLPPCPAHTVKPQLAGIDPELLPMVEIYLDYLAHLHPGGPSVQAARDTLKLAHLLNRAVDSLDAAQSLSLKLTAVEDLFTHLLNLPVVRVCTPLFFHTGLVYAELLEVFQAFPRVIALLRTLLEFARREDSSHQQTFKLKAYLRMSNALMSLGKYKSASLYAKRALEMAFLLKDQRSELRIYDLLGKLSYYQEDMMRSVYFHNRLFESHIEPAKSPIKDLLLKKHHDRLQEEISGSRLHDRHREANPMDMFEYSSDTDQEVPMSPTHSPSLKSMEPPRLLTHLSPSRQAHPFFMTTQSTVFRPVGKAYFRSRRLLLSILTLYRGIASALQSAQAKPPPVLPQKAYRINILPKSTSRSPR